MLLIYLTEIYFKRIWDSAIFFYILHTTLKNFKPASLTVKQINTSREHNIISISIGVCWESLIIWQIVTLKSLWKKICECPTVINNQEGQKGELKTEIDSSPCCFLLPDESSLHLKPCISNLKNYVSELQMYLDSSMCCLSVMWLPMESWNAVSITVLFRYLGQGLELCSPQAILVTQAHIW